MTTIDGSRETSGAAMRHLGLDLGGTNLKWAVLERSEGEWAAVARDQAPTRIVGDPERVPDAIVVQMGELAAAAIAAWGPIASIGIGVPGLYDPVTGATRFLPNVPGRWAGHPVGAPVGAATGLPVALINDARAFGLAELRLGASQGVRPRERACRSCACSPTVSRPAVRLLRIRGG